MQVGEVASFAELVAELALSYADERAPVPQTPLVEQIVAGALAVLPGAVAAAVETPGPDGRLCAPVMVGDDVARRLREIQNRSGEGPALNALHDHKQVAAMDLASDQRWPAFAVEARDAGVAAIVCTPMEVNGRRVGVLTLLGAQPSFGDPEEDIESLARIFAAHAAVALTGARQVNDMTIALSSREVIGQAKGILMERFKVAPEVAFTVLVRASSITNTKLRTVCERLCETGFLPGGPHSRSAPPRRSTPSLPAERRGPTRCEQLPAG